MEWFDTCVIVRVTAVWVATLHFCSCFVPSFWNILDSAIWVDYQWQIGVATGFCFINSFNKCWYFLRLSESPCNDFSGEQIYDTIKVYKTVLCPNVSYISTPNSVRSIWIKLFLKDIMKFVAKIRVSGFSGPRFNPLCFNAHLTHILANSALWDIIASLTKLLCYFRYTIVLLCYFGYLYLAATSI